MSEFVISTEHFSLRDTLCCGQNFRFRETGDGFTGSALGRRVTLWQDQNTLYSDLRDTLFRDVYVPFFALDIDYPGIKKLLSANATLRSAIAFAPGIRVMRQPLFEMLITFILSQNNNLKRIAGLVSRLSECFGEERDGFFDFPAPETLAALQAEQLAAIRCGYRAAYVIDAAQKWVRGEIGETALKTLPLAEARAALRLVSGVGPKVADCVLLFGAGRFDAFPEDVWIKRAMAELFPDGLPDFARPYAGIAQQYIFHYARHHLTA